MTITGIFFIIFSILAILYIVRGARGKRIPLLMELTFLAVYVFILVIVMVPSVVTAIERVFGVQSALNTLMYLAIFALLFAVLVLYQKLEKNRSDISQLTREIALLEKRKK